MNIKQGKLLTTRLISASLIAEMMGVLGLPTLAAAQTAPQALPLEVRRSTSDVLAQNAPPTQSTIPDLIEDLRNEDEQVRWNAIDALRQIGPAAVPALTAALPDLDERESEAAFHTLVDIGPTAVPALLAALQDPDASLRWVAAYALGEIGPAAKGVVPALISALNDPDMLVRRSAAYSLGNIGGPMAQTYFSC